MIIDLLGGIGEETAHKPVKGVWSIQAPELGIGSFWGKIDRGRNDLRGRRGSLGVGKTLPLFLKKLPGAEGPERKKGGHASTGRKGKAWS